MSMQKSIHAIRFLGLDMINEANSGHPGIVLGAAPVLYTLFTRHLKVTPNSSDWFNRDRFILAAGHGSALLYAMLHLSGYELSKADLKQFRQLDSRTPGHPEYGHTDGVEATTGPLGQGIANAVGLAMAEAYLRQRFNRKNLPIVDHHTYVLCGDGDMQEGVTLEALSLAGHLQLERLIVLFDSNDVQLDGPTKDATSEDIRMKMESMGFTYAKVDDANDLDALDEAITTAKTSARPVFIEIKSIIGFGATKQGTSATHGAPLGLEETERLRQAFNYPYDRFDVPDDVYRDFFEKVVLRNDKAHTEWLEMMDEYQALYPESFGQLEAVINRDFTLDYEQLVSTLPLGTSEATRNTIGRILPLVSEHLVEVLAGSADLSGSTKVKGINGDFTATNRAGRNINFGVREHAMAAIVNGMTLHHLKVFSGGFFIFSDYMKPAIRLAALMQIPSLFVFTHDSVAVGEDGPTHEPIEQLTVFRATPHLVTLRPSHANEVNHAVRYALESRRTPVAIVLTRQNVPVCTEVDYDTFKKGAYVALDSSDVDGILIATGSEVALALDAAEHLQSAHDIAVRVVAMPSMELFLKQPQKYQDSILPPDKTKRLAIELGCPMSWYRFTPHVHGIETFGKSAPGEKILEHFGFTAEHIAKKYRKIDA
ncbi:MAG: transketolase [Acholeplasmatales bacterium]|nr:MAG: transketolase [Acholeplasmatales bacterium]